MKHFSSDMWDRLSTVPVGRRTMLQLGLRLTAAACLSTGFGSALSACYRAPGTARDQLIFFSEDKEISMGVKAFHEVLRQARLNESPEINEMVHRVGDRIAAVANRPEYHWEFAVIQDDKMVNAFALPGGKVAVFTGILKYTKSEAGLATVMGHEVAHALQRHGAERISRGIIEQIAQIGALAGAATGSVDPGVAMGAMSAYGIGVSLPFNRRQESEADYIGLRLMAQAGYDPREAVPFWERMSGCPKNLIGKLCFRSQAAIPEFLSTHPSDITRINQIENWLPETLNYYRDGASPDRTPIPAAPPVFIPMPKTG